MFKPIKQEYSYQDFLITVGVFIVITAICMMVRALNLQDENIVLIYVFAAVLVAMKTDGYFYGVLFSLCAMLTVNFYFIYPKYSFSAMNLNHLISFGIMFFLTILTSILTSRSKENEKLARKREKDALQLYQITSKLSGAVSVEEILDISVSFFGKTLGLPTALLLCQPDGSLEEEYVYCSVNGKKEVRKVIKDRDILAVDPPSGRGYLVGNLYYEWPVTGTETVFGFVGFEPESIQNLSDEDLYLISQMVESVSMALDRIYFMQKEEEIRQENNEERYKSNLLRSISHDIRTPLAGIIGTSEILKERVHEDPEAYKEASIIYKESTWLYGLVQNILSLTRLQKGKLRITKELQVVEDIIYACIDSIRLRYPEQVVNFDEPDEVIVVPMDSKLVQQSIINLIDNAHKHSEPGKPIDVSIIDNQDGTVSVSVRDYGTGIREEDFPHLFSTFYTTHAKDPEKVRGFGLGLPIAEAIMKAHGGSITASNNADGVGACFTLTFPVQSSELPYEQENV